MPWRPDRSKTGVERFRAPMGYCIGTPPKTGVKNDAGMWLKWGMGPFAVHCHRPNGPATCIRGLSGAASKPRIIGVEMVDKAGEHILYSPYGAPPASA
jgi:hypothetical protein